MEMTGIQNWIQAIPVFINEETWGSVSSLPTAGWHLARTRASLPPRSLSPPPTVSYTPPVFRLQGKAHLMTTVPFPESRGNQMNADVRESRNAPMYRSIYSWHAYLGIMNNTNWRLLRQQSDLVPVTSALFFFPLSFTLKKKKRKKEKKSLKKQMVWAFPGGPVVQTLCFQCREHQFDLWLGN